MNLEQIAFRRGGIAKSGRWRKTVIELRDDTQTIKKSTQRV